MVSFTENVSKAEKIKDESELLLEKGNEDADSTKSELEKLLTSVDQEPVKNDEDNFEASLSSLVLDDTTTEVPIVEKTQQSTDADDIVMLSDDERDENGKLKKCKNIFSHEIQ